MIPIAKVDHVGIRIREKARSLTFYETLGFALIIDAGFEKGHPIVLRHPSGVVLNLLGPASEAKDENVLMDVEAKFAGITHVAYRVESLRETEARLAEAGIAITGRFGFGDMNAVFIRDPDRNVIELDEYPGDDPAARKLDAGEDFSAYDDHP